MARQRRCHYCNKILRDGDATRDHIVPKGWGGVNAQWNIVMSCRRCNAEKGMFMPNCACDQCVAAVFRWRCGERIAVVRYAREETWPGPTIEQEKKFCMVACANHGCPYPQCKWPERLEDEGDTVTP